MKNNVTLHPYHTRTRASRVSNLICFAHETDERNPIFLCGSPRRFALPASHEHLSDPKEVGRTVSVSRSVFRMLKKLPRLLFVMQPRALASFLCAVTMASAAQGADCVRVVSPAGRPILSEKDVPVQMSGYSPRFWDNTSRLQAHLDCFKSQELGYVFSGTPGWRATSWFWGENESIQTEPDYHGTNSAKFAHFDENVLVTVSNMPHARLIIRFGIDEAGIFEPESPWRKAHPEDMVLTETGIRLNVPSLASDLFWDKSARSAKALVNWYERQPYAGRIAAYANFWRMEGTHEATMMGWLSDRSPVMIRAWRAYLKDTYTTDERLQAAWGETNATIEAALPPADRLRGPVREVATIPYWQTGSSNAQFRDWLLCLRALFHQRVREVALALRDGCSGRVPIVHDMLKQTMQGWNIADYFNPADSSQPFSLELMSACGSSDVSKLLEIPGVDGLITPHDYQGRGMGGLFEPEGIADSCTLRGKLFLCEMDTRSYSGNFSGDESAPARNLAEFEAITWRNIATGISRGWWPYWMDLYANWFCDPAMQPIIARQAAVLNEATGWPHHDEPGIAVVVDDTATEETTGAGRFPFLAVSEQLRLGIGRCGVPYRIYLLEDLTRSNLPPHKVWYLPNLFRCDARRFALLKRIQRDGNVVVWGPGTGISDGKTISDKAASKLTGFSFKVIPGNYHRRGLFLGGHALTDGIAGQTFGDGIGYGPQLYPTNGFSLASAWTQQSKYASALSILPHTGWTSVFTAALPLPAGFWRNAARLANAHVWCETDDVLAASREIVALHSVVPGEKVIRLPRPACVTDLTSGAELSPSTEQIRFTLDTPGTRVFRLLEPRTIQTTTESQTRRTPH